MRKQQKELYNKEQKQEYISYYRQHERNLTNYFRRTSDYERQWDEDVADMSEEHLREMFISLNLRSLQARAHLISMLRGYVTWARLNDKSKSNRAIERITAESIKSQFSIINQMLKSPEQVEEILNRATRKGEDEQENRETREQLIFWLLYSGAKIEDLRALKKTDLNVSKKIVTCEDGITFTVNDRIVELWEKCAASTKLERNTLKSRTGTADFQLLDNDYLFRPIAGKKTDMFALCTKGSFVVAVLQVFKRYTEETGIDILVAPLDIRTSGIFYRMLLMEREGTELTPELVAKLFDYACTDNAALTMHYRNRKSDYEDWKIAFGHNV